MLRPICSGEVYFGHYVCNNSLIVFPKNINIKGTLCGLQENLLNSTIIWQELLTKGLSSYKKFEPLQRQEYINIGYALSTSAGCGTMDTAMTGLVQTLEYLGNNTSENISQQANTQIKQQTKEIKKKLVEYYHTIIEDKMYDLPENIKMGVEKSISRIQPWNPETIKKINALLFKYGWNIVFDLEEFKVIRDELAHSGMFPRDFPHNRRYELRDLYETILFVHALDLIGIEGRIAQKGKDGWKTYSTAKEVKNKV